ncbi:MAG: hypothetical protein IT430_00480 [Phycisphaerales bacterium]|nr:hypothetical protein [Phycisphaerales bacterium]
MSIGKRLAGLGVTVGLVVWSGCATSPRPPAPETPRQVSGAGTGQFVTAEELDGLSRAFADRYVGLLYSACEALKKDNPDPVQRREAQLLLLDGATNVYDIASNADSFTRVLDLVVITRLMSKVWVDDGRAEQVFGDRAAPLVDALVHSRDEAQALAARVLTDEHLAVLESLLVDWQRDNPEMIHASFVRFSNFAIGRGRSAASEVLAARGLFSEVGAVGQAVDEARLLGERVFYRLKREPTLLRWQLEAAKADLLATPEVVLALDDIDRMTRQLEGLPAHVAAERETILAAVDARMNRLDVTFDKAEDVVAETESLVVALRETGESLRPLLATADSLFTRYDAWHRWAVANGRPRFDIRQYTEMIKETGTTAHDLDEVLQSSADLLASPDWSSRIDEWKRAADGRIALAAEQSKSVIDGFFLRVYIALGALFALLILYRIITLMLTRRFVPGPTRN